jgi:hypothetical protein
LFRWYLQVGSGVEATRSTNKSRTRQTMQALASRSQRHSEAGLDLNARLTYEPPTANDKLTNHFFRLSIFNLQITGKGVASKPTSVAMLRHAIARANLPNSMHVPDVVGSHILRSGMHCRRQTRTDASVIMVRSTPNASRMFLNHSWGKMRRYRYRREILIV